MKLFMITAFIVVYIGISNAIQYTRCQLAYELMKFRMDPLLLKKWICYAEHASGRSTETIRRKRDFSKSYGIFQINNKHYCREGYKGGICKANCYDFLTGNLGIALECASKFVTHKEFRGCNRGQLPDLSYCFPNQNLVEIRPNTTITPTFSTTIRPTKIPTFSPTLRPTSKPIEIQEEKQTEYVTERIIEKPTENLTNQPEERGETLRTTTTPIQKSTIAVIRYKANHQASYVWVKGLESSKK